MAADVLESLANQADGAPLAPLVVSSLAVMGTPGPSTISLVASVTAFGARNSVAYCVGLIAGTAGVLLAVTAGVTAVILGVSELRWALIGLGSAYMLWLAYRIARAGPLGEPGAGQRSPSFADGMLIGVLNPKAWIALAALFASARVVGVVDAALTVAVLLALVVIVHVVWLFAGSLLAPAMRSVRTARLINGVLAGSLVVATAIALVI
jgi:threonine/homoserine/homoserine lactone efflux protein